MTLREKIEVMEAFERGAEVEHTPVGTQVWQPNDIPRWDWRKFDYRIKPKPKQTVMIEKWLMSYNGDNRRTIIVEGSTEEIEYWSAANWKQVKLICTYEVPL